MIRGSENFGLECDQCQGPLVYLRPASSDIEGVVTLESGNRVMVYECPVCGCREALELGCTAEG